MTPGQALRDRSMVRSEALMLLAHASGRTRESLIASPEATLPHDVASEYERLRARRIAGEPVAYLLGHREFYGRRFAVGPRVLIPRPETELLIDLVCAGPESPGSILDLGTGSGVIAITLALERPAAIVTGTDVSADALEIARVNGRALNASVAWHEGSWFDALDEGRRFDLIVSNPPYIAIDDSHLGEGDLRFEPQSALTDGHDGLDAIRCIVAGAPSRLTRSGRLMVEHGHDQAALVRSLFVSGGFVDIASSRDLAGIERITVGTLAGGVDGQQRRD